MNIIDNYADLPVGKYLDILAANAGDAEDIDKQVATIAILTDKTEDEILALPVPDYTVLARAADFLRHEDKGEHRMAKRYTLGGLALVPCTDARKMTTAQYIDFQTLTKDGDYDRHLAEILSCFLVPEGKAYGTGYDFAEVQDAIRRHLSVTDALSLLAFFFRIVAEINGRFPNLVGAGDEGGEGQDAAAGDPAEDPGDAEVPADPFSERWGWVAAVDRASETARCSWDAMLEKPALEFLNTLAYRADKEAKERADIERWKRTH